MPDIIAAPAQPGRTLDLTFSNGYQGTLRLDTFIQHYIGVFVPLLDKNYFSLVTVDPNLGSVCWPNGVDLCPDSVYTHMKKVKGSHVIS